MSAERSSPKSLSELEIVQNPALGAYSIWQFANGYQENAGDPAPFPLAFLVLPLLLHSRSLSAITSTKKTSGLGLFASKLGADREELLAVHGRARVLRYLTLQSIAMGLSARILTVDYQAATVRGNSLEGLGKKPTLPERIKSYPGAADKLGYWFSKVALPQIAASLFVEF